MPPKKRTSNSSKKKKGGTTVLDKIVFAVRQLKDPGAKGSSRTAITKYLKSECGYDNSIALKKAFKKGVQDNVLVQTGQSFRVAEDPVVESSTRDDEQLKIEDVPSSLPSSSAAVIDNNSNKDDDDDDNVKGAASKIAEAGDVVTVAYRGTLDDGYEFDKASKFKFVLGAGEVIKGWDLGVANMKVGTKRRLTVPSKLGYGKRGCKPDIPPNATLNFVVTLKSLKKR
eukprot:CAMPEP_0168185860 /NCGR_PEP_ID=MMETSP0139_2-20121125/14087_1 /TAXON_ID=44445 /ORGANISM="Pseudo-nitzschia australis, Strain 10249 10 AB" /LENGTH=226 /DNA_ID=CAMNT_0008107755 /DNA_START=60 /DNA_END=740 /DNA_ORIENTATION=-